MPPQARWAAAGFLLLAMAHALQQAIRGAPLPAVVACGAATCAAWVYWRWLRDPANPSVLQLAADGQIRVRESVGLQQVSLQPDSTRMGGWLLLHLKTADGRSIRLLLGPNLAPAGLAALNRRLRRPPTAAGPVL